MFANERRAQICDLLKQKSAVTTAELMERFQVSIETIRRDLLVLEQKRLLQRVHGGAVADSETRQLTTLSSRKAENEAQKRELSLTAAELIKDGDVIAVDAGSTAFFFAEMLRQRFSALTVVTHSLDVFQILNGHREFRVLLCGGEFFPQENAFGGCFTLDMLKRINVQKTFFFPLTVSLRHGLCDYHTELCDVQRQLIECGTEVYALADSSKFEKKALLRVADMNSAYTYITDSGLSEELKNLYRENHINIITRKEDVK